MKSAEPPGRAQGTGGKPGSSALQGGESGSRPIFGCFGRIVKKFKRSTPPDIPLPLRCKGETG